MTNLMQTETWTQRDGTEIPLTDMSTRHQLNVVALLERRAPLIEMRYTIAELGRTQGPSGDMACDMYEAELDARANDPVAWLHTLPLVAELDRLIAAAGDGAP